MITCIFASVTVTSVSLSLSPSLFLFFFFGYAKFCSCIASFHSSWIPCHLKLVAYKGGEGLEWEAQWERQLGGEGACLPVGGIGRTPAEVFGGEAARPKPRVRWGQFVCGGQVDEDNRDWWLGISY